LYLTLPETFEGLEVSQFRKVDWLLKDVQIPVEKLYNKQFSQQTIYKLNKSEIKEEFFVKNSVTVKQEGETKKNYVLILDEINRGNISSIFGELIPLIEEDKRKGKDEALEVLLPYSKEAFSVPSNLFIIGTMNTADRSVEALDTALRRRFAFEEMKPMPEFLGFKHMLCFFWNMKEYIDVEYEDWIKEPYLSKTKAFCELFGLDEKKEKEIIENEYYETERKDWQIEDLDGVSDEDFTGVNLEKLLEVINERLNALLSKDHTIGHAWLMNIYSIQDLQAAFKNKILPLFQEYFYNNYSKIGLVLGDQFFEEPLIVNKGVFAKFKNADAIAEDYNDKMIYRFKDADKLTIENFKSIYE